MTNKHRRIKINQDSPESEPVFNDVDRLLQEAQPPEVPILMPVCPHCGERPARVASTPFNLGPGAVAMSFFCGNPLCQKLFGVQLLTMPPPPQAEQKLIHTI